jgi:hypothetical protein
MMANLSNVGLIFTSPAAVARKVGERPDWKVPLVVLILLSVVFSYALQLTPYQAEYQRDMLEKYKRESGRDIDINAVTRPTTGKTIAAVVGATVMTLLFTVVAAAVLNGAAMLVGGTAGFVKMLSFFAYAMVIDGAGNLVRIPLMIAKKSIDVRLSLGAFAPNVRLESPTGLLLGSTDIFSLWCLVATAIGFSVLTGLGRKKSAAIVVVLYVILVLLQIGASYLTTRAMS